MCIYNIYNKVQTFPCDWGFSDSRKFHEAVGFGVGNEVVWLSGGCRSATIGFCDSLVAGRYSLSLSWAALSCDSLSKASHGTIKGWICIPPLSWIGQKTLNNSDPVSTYFHFNWHMLVGYSVIIQYIMQCVVVKACNHHFHVHEHFSLLCVLSSI